jgi:hypothetical protein
LLESKQRENFAACGEPLQIFSSTCLPRGLPREFCTSSMARQTSKPPTARVSGWGVTGSPEGKGRFLSKAQFAELRRKRADVHAKLRQMVYAERERRR